MEAVRGSDLTSEWSNLPSSRFHNRLVPITSVLDTDSLEDSWELRDDPRNLSSSSLFFVKSVAFSFSIYFIVISRLSFSVW